jgi:glutaconate CoA-transferase, subunit A
VGSESKVMSMQEAISNFVHDGDHLVLGGFVTNRKPYAAVHEIIRQGVKDLYLQSGPGGGDVDLLIGANCVKVLFNSYVANSGYTQVGRQFRKYIEEGKILCEDYSLDVQPIMYHAAALGLPYVPVKNMLGSSLIEKWGIPAETYKNDPKLPACKLIVTDNPFNPGEKVCLLPTPKMDVAILHVQQAAPDGTCRIDGPTFIDIDIAMGAKNCIVTCEQIVHPDWLRQEPWRNQLPKVIPVAVVEAPFGAHPSQCSGCYDYDGIFMRMYDKVSGNDELFDNFLNEYIRGTKDHKEYLNKLEAGFLMDLKVKNGWNYVPGLKRK